MKLLSNEQLQCDVFKKLIIATLNSNESEIELVRKSVTTEEYFELFFLQNFPHPKFCLIHYAICFQQTYAIRFLLKELSAQQKFEICNKGVTENKVNALHIAINNNL